ncbi:MAG: hypothetical protein E7043_02430 [Lentisphaerae bacterium]|nr:hypothetical protein [Lentisphaerota bacterium]
MKFERGKLCIGSARLGWKLGFGNGRKDTEIKYISDCDMPLFTPAPDGGIWQNGTGLAVKVTYAEIDGILQGSICFTGNDGINTPVEEVIFPCAEMDFDETVKILTPTSQGRILKNLTGQWDAGLLEYSGGRYRSFRFTAAFSDRCGIYFDCRDSSFYNKSYSWRKEGGKLVYSHIHYPALDGKGEFTLPYRCGVTAFSGGWFEAAMIYRKWAVEQVWFKNALREKNPLKDISMWLWNRGRIDYVLPPAEKLAEDAKVPIALDWYWWHHNPYDTDYPDFWPPREGEEAFKDAVKRMNDKGIFTQVYINGRTWDLDGPSWHEGGADEIEIKRDGSEFAIAFNSYNHHRLGYMCGEAPVFQRKMADLVKTLCNTGLPGVYLDMIGCTSGTNCYNPKHQHAPGGGDYNIKGFRRMMETIQQENPGKLFSTEDCSENWLDIFSSMIVLGSTSSERMGDDSDFVPAFSAVYHGANALFGSYALPDAIPPWDEFWPADDRFPAADEQDWNALYPCQFFLELARDIVWGMQPMICNFQLKHATDPRFAEVYKYILDTAKFYYENRDILYSAEMVSPGILECEKIPVDFIVRGIFTHKEHLRTIRKDAEPAICHSVWKNPSGGRTLILANYTPAERGFKFEDVSGTLPPRSYKRIDLL